ncbi:branched-chain amino acid ABC transporter permease [Streptococcus sp. X13SY08]|uniref:branched-chain amino acid ABC transporter permease n=1 Tax=Streptococcus sp. X13SY08 TaxID=1676616 RepID=UPI00066FBC49|nr:branched-chain amino acid ABC transporter permease [Streptococcus sp. X13SY08]
MKQNSKANIAWFVILVAGFLILNTLISTGMLTYTVGIIGTRMPNYAGFIIALVVGMVVSGIIALLVGIPTLRLKGDYLAIATLGVAEIIRIVIINGSDVTNGAAGIIGIPLFTNWQMVYAFVVVTTILTLNFLRSPIGRATISVREDEIAAESVGVNPTKMKVVAFVIGAMTAAVAGGLHAGYVGAIVPKDFAFMTSVNIFIIIVLGGLGSMTGTFLAAIALGILNVFLKNYSDISMIIYSLALILIMIFRPGGLLGTKELPLSRFFKQKEETN